MRLWSIWNLFSSLLYFIGFIIGCVFFALILTVFLPTFIALLFAFCVTAGIVLGIYGNVSRSRQIKRDAVDKELADIAAGRSPDTDLTG